MTLLRRSLMPAAFVFAVVLTFLGYFAFVANAQVGVTETPRTDTLQVTDGEVLDSLVVGNRIIVVGTFTEVQNAGGATIDQPYIAAYNADTGQFDNSFRPDVDNFVNAIDTDGTNLFIVGQFSNAGGEAHRRIAKLNPDGSVDSNFNASFGSTPNTVAVAHSKVYVGGPFSVVNGQSRTSLAAVDTNTGALDTATNFEFSFSNRAGGGLGVDWIDISDDGSFMFVSHGARFIDGEIRSGIARFDISPNSTSLNSWQTLLYDNELERLGGVIRSRRLAIAPSGDYVVMVTSGGDRPPAADTAVRFPASGGANVQADWVSRHFDTVLGVAINDDAVFVGGHFQFQEAPGSDDPFPGDPLTNFGFGQNQGPLSLGSQVVQREQLGALDPATGKSLAWNPGSDSFIGVQSLTWDDRYGLLVGHDGNRLGGISDIGRHAIFPRGNTPTPPPEPDPTDEFSCNAVLSGGQADITFEGDLGSSLQARRNDAWAATVTGDTVTIAAEEGDLIEARLRGPNYANPFEDITCTTEAGDPPSPNGNFSCNAVFSNGQATISFEGDRGFSLQVRRNDAWAGTVTDATITINANDGDIIEARLRGAAFEAPFEDFECSTDAATPPPGGVAEISTTITAPGVGAVVDGGTVTLAGESEAPGGISTVRLSLVRRSTGEYLNADGTYTAAWAPLDIDLDTTDETADWSIDVNLEFADQYDLVARTFDNNNVRDTPVSRSFIVVAAASEAPELLVDAPTFRGNEIDITGTATDDVGVSSVNFLIQNRDTLEYFRNDGTLGAAERFTTTLSNPGGTSTTWTRTISGLPVGQWQITADAFDTAGQRDRRSRIFTQGGEIAPPEITLTSGDGQKLPANSRFTFEGVATADAGVEAVQILIRNVVDQNGVGASGELIRQGGYFTIPGTNGGTTQNWSYTTPNLATGTYDVIIRVVDELGSLELVRTQFVAGPSGDDLPTTTFDATNRFAQGVDSLTIDISGTAADDIAVSEVTIGVFDREVSMWLQPDGTYQRYPTPFLADLSAPGTTETDWDFTFTAPAAGEYQFFVRAVDSAGQADTTRDFGSFRAFPGDEIPTLDVELPTDGLVIANNRISANGVAFDDNSVNEVELRIRNEETLEYLRVDGSFGNAQWLEASVTNFGGTRTNWNYTSPVLPDGEWRVQIRAIDNNNQDTVPFITRTVTLN